VEGLTGSALFDWTSGTASVASVTTGSRSETITGNIPGKATISVTVTAAGGATVSKTIEVTVEGEMTLRGTGAALSGGTDHQYSVNLVSGTAERIDLEAQITPQNGSLKLTWSWTPASGTANGAIRLSAPGSGQRATVTLQSSAKDGDGGTIRITGDGVPDTEITVTISKAARNQSGVTIAGKLPTAKATSKNDSKLDIKKQ